MMVSADGTGDNDFVGAINDFGIAIWDFVGEFSDPLDFVSFKEERRPAIDLNDLTGIVPSCDGCALKQKIGLSETQLRYEEYCQDWPETKQSSHVVDAARKPCKGGLFELNVKWSYKKQLPNGISNSYV